MSTRHGIQRVLSRSRQALTGCVLLGAACVVSEQAGPDSDITELQITPSSVALAASQSIQFHALGRTRGGGQRTVQVSWSASSGTIDDSGMYTADTSIGDFDVIATLSGAHLTGSSKVRIGGVLKQIVLLPSAATVAPQGTVQFSDYGLVSNGDSVTVSPTFSVTGGVIGGSGLYTAGAAPGTFRVIATAVTSRSHPPVADTSVVTVGSGGGTPMLAQIVLVPSSVTMTTGSTHQFATYGKTNTGDSVVVSVTYAATGGTITSSGLYTAGSTTGSFHVLATLQNPALGDTSFVTIVSASPVQSPDPTLLPTATTSQMPLTTAYNTLNVPAIAAGGSYRDPTTAMKIYKVTSATFPTASSNWHHDYAEGGDEVSLPYSGATRAVLVHGDAGYWLVDFTPGVGVGNGRRLTGSLVPVHDQAFAFSSNPATPYYAYVSNGTSVLRIDIRTLTEAPGNGWPVTNETEAVWLQQSENDGFFVWMRGQSGPTVVGYQPGTRTLKTYSDTGIDEPRIDRAGRYVGLTMRTPAEALYLWDWNTNTITWQTAGDPGIPFIHVASLRDRWLDVDWNSPSPFQYSMFTPNVPNSAVHIGGPTNSGHVYGNGNWNQHPADLNDQWALFSHYGGLVPGGAGWLAPGGMVFITANGERRLVGHTYDTSITYALHPFARMSADGRYAMFTSNMNGSGRSDVFLAEVPTR